MAAVKYWLWRLRNPWLWPVLFELGCWWERRYRPERWQGGKTGAILIYLPTEEPEDTDSRP